MRLFCFTTGLFIVACTPEPKGDGFDDTASMGETMAGGGTTLTTSTDPATTATDTTGTTSTTSTTDMPALPVSTTDRGDGSFETRVDASSYEDWVYVSFEDGSQVEPADPMTDLTWDLAFQRYHVATNGGASGSGDVAVAVLAGVAFDDVFQAPDGPWIQDEPDADGDDRPEYTMADWYLYDYSMHTLSPDDITYVVQLQSGSFIAFRWLDYYFDSTSGHPLVEWAPIDAP